MLTSTCNQYAQPMTILMARILLSEAYKVSDEQRRAANLSLIAASNVGANFSLIGSLAAVMWIKLLKVSSAPRFHCLLRLSKSWL